MLNVYIYVNYYMFKCLNLIDKENFFWFLDYTYITDHSLY